MRNLKLALANSGADQQLRKRDKLTCEQTARSIAAQQFQTRQSRNHEFELTESFYQAVNLQVKRRGSISQIGLGEILLITLTILGILYGITPWITAAPELKSSTGGSDPIKPILRVQMDRTGEHLWIQRGFSEILDLDLKSLRAKRTVLFNEFHMTSSGCSNDLKTNFVVYDGTMVTAYHDGELVFSDDNNGPLTKCHKLSGDGQAVGCLTDNGDFQLWRQRDHRFERIELAVSDQVGAMAFGDAGGRVALSLSNGSIGLHDIDNDLFFRKIAEGEFNVTDMELSPDGKWITLVRPQSITLYDVDSSNRVWQRFDHGKNTLLRAGFSSNGALIAVSSENCGIQIIDRDSGSMISQLPIQSIGTRPSFSASSDQLLLGNREGSIEIWSIAERKIVQSIQIHDSMIDSQ